MSDRYVFRRDGADGSEVRVSCVGDHTWPEVLQEFFHFLKGCGFVFHQDEDLVTELARANDFKQRLLGDLDLLGPIGVPEGSLVVTKDDIEHMYERTSHRWFMESEACLQDLLWNELQHVVRDREVAEQLKEEDQNDGSQPDLNNSEC